MRISVVIPVYNKALFVERALESVLKQTRSADDIIVIDDGSTDGSLEIASRYEAAGVRVHQQANAGPGAARNRGVSMASGDLLAFLDADDEWLPEYLQVMEREFEADSSLSVASCGYIEQPPGCFREERLRRQGLTDGIQAFDASSSPSVLSWSASFMWTCATVARMEVFRRWGGFYEVDKCRYGEDQVLWLKWLLNERVRFLLQPHAVYHRYASDLNQQRRGARPLEPFLVHPEILYDCCDRRLHPLLDSFLAVRAMRAAMMLGFWGRSSEARPLIRRFVSARELLSPTGLSSVIACTPFARWLGVPALHALKRLRSKDFAHL